jgi:broad specificity polyphosphatase/5'/3'-nucleotidase SurE
MLRHAYPTLSRCSLCMCVAAAVAAGMDGPVKAIMVSLAHRNSADHVQLKLVDKAWGAEG